MNTRCLSCLFALLALSASTASALTAPAVTTVGPVEESLVERAVAWAVRSLAVEVPVVATEAPEAITLEAAATALAEQVGEDEGGLVGLVWTDEPVPTHGFYWPEDRVVIVNVRAFLTGDADEETRMRRIERQVIRGLSLLYGVEPSPMPTSANWTYTTMEQLDAIGRNLDPPSVRALQQQAEAWGVTVDTANPMYMLR